MGGRDWRGGYSGVFNRMTEDIKKQAADYIRKHKIDVIRVGKVFKAIKKNKVVYECRAATLGDAIIDTYQKAKGL